MKEPNIFKVTITLCVSIICLGQDLLPDFTCKKKLECDYRAVLDRLRILEEKIGQHTSEIGALEKRKTELELDIDGLRDVAVFLLENLPDSSGNNKQPPLVYGFVPYVKPPSYNIPITDNMGQEFYFMLPSTQSLYHQIMISSEYPGWLTIEIPHLNSKENISIIEGTTYRNISGFAAHYEAGMERKGIHIKSSTPVTIYNINVNKHMEPYVFPVLHKGMLGKSYVASTLDGYDIGITAISDNTTLTITLQTNFVYDGRLYKNGEIFTVKMDRYSTLKVLGQPTDSLNGHDKLITSDKPIAVFQGRDLMDFKQLRSVDNWGRLFVIPHVTNRGFISVTPFVMNTSYTVHNNNQSLTNTINKSVKHDIDNISILESDKPVSVAYHSKTSLKSVPIPPVSHLTYNLSCPLPYFYRPYQPAYENRIYIVTKSKVIPGLKINDYVVSSSDVKEYANVLNFTVSQIDINMSNFQHAHVVSKDGAINAFVIGHLHGEIRSYTYIYQCV